jgi:hypothetical protein
LHAKRTIMSLSIQIIAFFCVGWQQKTITAFKFILFACRKGGSYKRAA